VSDKAGRFLRSASITVLAKLPRTRSSPSTAMIKSPALPILIPGRPAVHLLANNAAGRSSTYRRRLLNSPHVVDGFLAIAPDAVVEPIQGRSRR
jgi:hypothetical protein